MGRQPYKSIEERCQETLAYVTGYITHHRIAPSYEDIMKSVGLKSRGHLAPIIERLIEDGHLEREDGLARGLRLPGWTPSGGCTIPLKGYIAASNENPHVVLDEMDAHTTVEIPPSFIPRNTPLFDLYALTVQGDSMNAAMIADGDTVILRKGDSWNDGDIVAIWLNNEGALTLKRLYQGRNDTLKLKPESHRHQARLENRGDVRVMGRLVGVLRKYDKN